MAIFKITISDKKGKSITRELKEKDANPLLGLQIGTEVDAAIIGQPGKIDESDCLINIWIFNKLISLQVVQEMIALKNIGECTENELWHFSWTAYFWQ